jgi:Zn-dependent protease with chaperone function
MSEFAFGLVVVLAWFAAVNLAASALVSALARSLRRGTFRLRMATGATGLLALKLFPGAVSLFFVLGLLLPAQWRFEPKGAEESAGICLIVLAAVGGLTLALAVRRATRDTCLTTSLERAWLHRASTPGRLRGVDLPVYRLPDAAPIIALVGLRKPRLYVAQPVLDAFTAEELEACLSHELAHRDTRDNLKRVLVACSPDLLALWRSGRRLEQWWRAAVEFAADARAVQGDEERAVCLASALLKVVRLAPVGPPLSVGFSDGTLLWARIDRLLGPAAEPAAARALPAAWSLGLAAAVLCGAALAAEGTWLTVHAVTEGLIRFLP